MRKYVLILLLVSGVAYAAPWFNNEWFGIEWFATSPNPPTEIK